MQSYDPKDKETKHGSESPIEQQGGDNSDSTTPLAIVKNKKRVHYPYANGDQTVLDTDKTDNHNNSADMYSKSKTGSSEKPNSGDHVIPIENERFCGCCSTSKPFGQRLNLMLNPWREFFEYQSGWSWVILVASFLTYSIGEALTSVFPILFVALQKEFPNHGSSRIALVQSMMNAVPCLAGPVASISTTRLGYRKTAMLGGLITSVSLLATSFARRLELIYFTMGICYAIGNSLVLVSTVVAVTEHFDAKPSFASGVTISGGAFGQCVFAIVLQKLIDKYDWNGAMMLFSSVVLFIVAFGALFREVEWDEEDYEEEEEGEEEETENGTETISTAIAPSEQSEQPVETAHAVVPGQDTEQTAVRAASNTPPPTHKPSITDDLVFYDQFTKHELLDQYSKSEICLPLAIREQLENEHRLRLEQEERERDFPEQKLSSSTTQIEQTDEIHRAAEVPPIVERSNSCKDLPLLETTPLTTQKSTPNNPPSNVNNPRKSRSHHRRTRRTSTNTPHENKPLMFHYPLHHQHRTMPAVVSSAGTRTHHHHHHHPLHMNRGNLSHLALCSKNIYNYESVLNICKLQSLHFSIDRSLSLPNLYSPIIAGRKRHRSLTITGDIDDYLEDEDEEDDETRKKGFFEQLYRDICKLVRVLRILPFSLLCICVTMITIFYDATWTFLVDFMNQKNLSAEKGSHIILGVGVVAIIGEIGYGYMGDSKRISPLHIYAGSLCTAGLLQLLIPFAITKFTFLMPLMLFTGFLQSAQEVLMPILCIKFAGTQNFTNAYGMLLLAQGVSSLVGPPTLGYIADLNSYNLTYCVIGIGTALPALLLFSMPLVQRFYGFLTLKSNKRKTNTLVTASNGDIQAQPATTTNTINNGSTANIKS